MDFFNDMKTIATVMYILAIVCVMGVAYWLLSPLFIDTEVRETAADIRRVMSAEDEQIIVAKGKFMGMDNFHRGEGSVKIINTAGKYFIRIEDDFKVTNGPDLFVYFGKDGKYASETKIAALKGNIGGQNYEVPDSIDVAKYNEIWIWCRAFSVPFARALLLK